MSNATAPSSKNATYLAQKGLKRAKNDRVWDWLRDVAGNVRQYMQAPAILLPMLNDPSLTATIVTQGNSASLTELIQRLGGDVQSYTQRYSALYTRHSQRRGSSSNSDDMFASVAISQDYLQFMSSYESVVMPTILEILEILDKAGLDTKSVRAMADGQLVYNLYNEAAAATSDDA